MTDGEKIVQEEKKEKEKKWVAAFQKFIKDMESDNVFFDVSVTIGTSGVIPHINLVAK